MREGGREVSDITVKLRAGFGGLVPILCDEAANEIDKLRARIATLEALIADAPHSKDCPRSSKHSSFLSCNCFKSRALDTKEKSND